MDARGEELPLMDATFSVPSTAVLQLDELVGIGGFGRVHRATHQISRAPLAVKILTPSRVDNEDEIAQEVRLLKSCRSAHVVQYHAALFHTDGRLWICMEFCEASLLDIVEASLEISKGRSSMSEPCIAAVTAGALDGLRACAPVSRIQFSSSIATHS
jgi:serine/threonine protein kinase